MNECVKENPKENLNLIKIFFICLKIKKRNTEVYYITTPPLHSIIYLLCLK